ARGGRHRGREVTIAGDDPAGSASASDWPVIPAAAWRRGSGVRRERGGHPRVAQPILDDGEFSGVPIGGLGTGSIGRTYRGDAARGPLEGGSPRPEAGGGGGV